MYIHPVKYQVMNIYCWNDILWFWLLFELTRLKDWFHVIYLWLQCLSSVFNCIKDYCIKDKLARIKDWFYFISLQFWQAKEVCEQEIRMFTSQVMNKEILFLSNHFLSNFENNERLIKHTNLLHKIRNKDT